MSELEPARFLRFLRGDAMIGIRERYEHDCCDDEDMRKVANGRE